jgi:hypothetical protein
VPEVFGFVEKNLVWRYPERSEGSAPRAERGVRGKELNVKWSVFARHEVKGVIAVR